MKLNPVPASQGISVLYGHRVLPHVPTGITPYTRTTITPTFLDDFLTHHAHWQALSIYDLQTGNYHADTPAFVLTFDDGYRDHLTHLLPILDKHDVPAAIFLCAGFLDGTLEPLEHDFASRLQPNQYGVYHTNRDQLKRGSLSRRRSKLRALIQKYDLPPFPHPTEFLNTGDVHVLTNHPLITLGHHTKTHPLLSRLMPWYIWDELQSPYKTIAYPYGGHHLMVRALSKLRGYTMGFTTKNRLYHPKTDNALAIPRIELTMS